MKHLLRCVREQWLILAPAALLLLAGCHKPSASAPASGPTPAPAPAPAPGVAPGVGGVVPAAGRLEPSNDLQQFYLYYNAQASTGTPPTRLEDLRDLRVRAPRLYQAIQDGTYVVNWNARPAGAASQTVLAYVRDAPTRGGPAVMLDGSVQNLTPEQFRAASGAGR
jgi:hypothetical protein